MHDNNKNVAYNTYIHTYITYIHTYTYIHTHYYELKTVLENLNINKFMSMT
jgi:hypothetical protein